MKITELIAKLEVFKNKDENIIVQMYNPLEAVFYDIDEFKLIVQDGEYPLLAITLIDTP